MNQSRSGVSQAFRRVALPLASYYAVTLALPIANGTRSGAFLGHALIVLLVPLLLILAASTGRAILLRLTRRCTSLWVEPGRARLRAARYGRLTGRGDGVSPRSVTRAPLRMFGRP